MNLLRKQKVFLSNVLCCTYTRASFLVVHLVRPAFKPGSLSRQNCNFSPRTHEQIKLVEEKIAHLYGADNFITALVVWKLLKEKKAQPENIKFGKI